MWEKDHKYPNRQFCKQFYIALILESPDSLVNLAGAVNSFKSLLGEVEICVNDNSQQYDLQTVEIEFTVSTRGRDERQSFKNSSKGNELPDYLFPNGKTVKRRKRSNKTEGSEAKRTKV